MKGSLLDWVILVRQSAGERYSLSYIGRLPIDLSKAPDALSEQQSLDWSGLFYGSPAVLDYIIRTQKYDVTPRNVLPITGGTSMGNFLACMALLKSGDEAVVEMPAWPQVGKICQRMGIEVRPWYLRRDNRWKPRLEELKQLVSPRTKLIYINHPNNPTGSVLSEGEVTDLCNIASTHDAYVLSDEVYRGLEWESDEISPSVVNYYERGISTSSLTKTLGVNGIRFGWLATRDKRLFDDCFNIYVDSVLAHNVLSERVGERLLEPSRYRRILEEGKEIGRKNLRALSELVNRNPLWSLIFPAGSYSCFLKYHTKERSWDFCERMLNKKPVAVSIVPGSCFHEDCEYHLRVGFGGIPEQFQTALKLLEEGADQYKGGA